MHTQANRTLQIETRWPVSDLKPVRIAGSREMAQRIKGTKTMFETTGSTKNRLGRRVTEYSETATDEDSISVMIAAERRDKIEITEVVQAIGESADIPDHVSVIQRTDRYYGPELLVHTEVDDEDRNYRLTAPGPDTNLLLWGEKINNERQRSGWVPVAEIRATMESEQPPYQVCEQCGELIRTMRHERKSISGKCGREETWQ